MSERIEKTIEMKAPVERVWEALTDHAQFGQWFQVKIDAPFVVGEASTGWMTYPGFEDVRWRATVREMERPRRFAYTWPHPVDMRADEPGAPETLVEFILTPTPEGTRLTVIESGFEAIPAERRMKHLRQNEGGWAEQTRNIKAYVEA